ncbi:MAG: hypothetical protein NTW52_03020 [Planctomycetota bacterium]|nr:hypothetical protein [Planctomycetota bacterium]
MADAETEPKQTSEAMLQRGKLALESLQFREEAARIHAARIDLQAALGDAESGNTNRLQNWLDQYQSLLDNAGGHLVKSSIAAASFDPASLQPTILGSIREHSQHKSPATNAPQIAMHLDLKDDFNPDPQQSICLPAEAIEPVTPELPKVKKSPWDSMIQAALAREQAALAEPTDASNLANETGESAELRFATDPQMDSPARLDSAAQIEESILKSPLIDDEPITIPESLLRVVSMAKEPENNIKKLLWLSPALLWSTGAHLVAVVGMSAYVITMATRTEPMAIIASPVDSQTVSMDLPTEIAPMDTPEVEPTTMSTPNLPTVTTPLASVSTSTMALPTSVAGDAPSQMPSTLGSEVGDAIGSAMNAVPSTTGAQFFGVKATGNSFCYIVDRSGSMKGGAFESAKEEIVRSLSTMKPKQRFFIFFFGEEIEAMKLDGKNEESFPVYATPENIQKTIVWMDRVKIQSGKHPAEVIERAIEMDPDGIFLLFDGETTVDLAPKVRKFNTVDDFISGQQTRVPIHSVCFYTEKPEAQQLMKTIAQQNLGTYRYVPKPK